MKSHLKKAFTLVEVMVSMALFAGIMALLMQYFSSAQRIWMGSAGKTEMFENARVALDLMENDLLCSYYSYGPPNTRLFFFPQIATDATTGCNYYQFGVASLRPSPPNTLCKSSLCEVQYRYDPSQCRLLMSVMGDHCSDGTSNTDWDLTNFASAVSATSNPFTTLFNDIYDPTDSTSDKDGWCEVIPYVVDFSYKLYDKAGNRIPSANYDNTNIAANYISGSSRIPYSVLFTITLVDRDSYGKYLAKGGTFQNIASTTDPLIVNSKRSFSRKVTIERGQYD